MIMPLYRVTAILFASLPQCLRSATVRGVAPSDESKYEGATFSCLQTKVTIPGTAINDNFCDCSDGSDEPGTGACAGVVSESSQPWFYCPNSGGAPRYLYPSRVGDGICDCCDGSDEWQTGRCADLCEAHGRAHREELERMKQSMQRGMERKNQAIAAMREKAETSRERLAELRASLPSLQATERERMQQLEEAERQVLVSRKEKGDTVSDEDREGLKAAELEMKSAEMDMTVSEYAKWMEKDGQGNAAGSAGQGPVVSEYAKWMDKGEGTDASTGIDQRPTERRTLERIEVRSGDLVDFVTFVYSDGERLTTGDGDGNPQEPFDLKSGETITEIRGGQGGLLDSIQFITDAGRESPVYGGSGGDRYSALVQPGMQIIGLERGAGTAGKIEAVQVCESVDRRSPEEVTRDNIKWSHKSALREWEKAQAEIRDLEAMLEGHFTDQQAAYSLFTEKCAEATLEGYRYSICLFGEARQDYNTLGHWKGWDSRIANVGHFDRGASCFSGRTRTLRVSVKCAENVEILQVREPSQCVYEAKMTHPAACDPRVFEDGVEAQVIMPNEMHDEL